MTGPEHYREAERFLRIAEAADDVATTQSLAAIAQAHALLAASAATVDTSLAVEGRYSWKRAFARRPRGSGDAS